MTIEKKINKILVEWNPLGVDNKNVLTEYKDYIQDIILIDSNRESLKNYLNHIVKETMGLDIINKEKYKRDIESVIDKIVLELR